MPQPVATRLQMYTITMQALMSEKPSSILRNTNLTNGADWGTILFERSNKVRDVAEQDWLEPGASVAHALAHPVRLRILESLRNEGAYVMHLTTTLGRPQANISQHLGVLRDAGLVQDEREGMTVIYRVRDPRIFDLVDQMRALVGASTPRACGHARTRCAPHAGRGHGCHCPHCARK